MRMRMKMRMGRMEKNEWAHPAMSGPARRVCMIG